MAGKKEAPHSWQTVRGRGYADSLHDYYSISPEKIKGGLIF